jgi:hypothetical protein
MVRRGSTVRVRQRAFGARKSPEIGDCCCLEQHHRAPPAAVRTASSARRSIRKLPAKWPVAPPRRSTSLIGRASCYGRAPRVTSNRLTMPMSVDRAKTPGLARELGTGFGDRRRRVVPRPYLRAVRGALTTRAGRSARSRARLEAPRLVRTRLRTRRRERCRDGSPCRCRQSPRPSSRRRGSGGCSSRS